MMEKVKAQLRERRGQAIVEMVIVLPVLLLIFSSIVDIGHIYQQSLLVNEAAREGARLATLSQSLAEIKTAVNVYGENLNVVEGVNDKEITITVSSTVTLYTPLMKKIFTPNPYPVKASVTMLQESGVQ